MSRVRWMSSLIAVVIALCLNNTTPAQSPARRATAAADMTPSGTLTVAGWQFPSGCNPILYGTAPACAGLWDGLFLISPSEQVQPDLAAVVPTLANGGVAAVDGDTVVTYTLKTGLHWSDGSPLTMDDVVFSFDLLPSLSSVEQVSPIAGITETSSLTAVVRYRGINAAYLTDGTPWIVPKAYLEAKYGTDDLASIGAAFVKDSYASSSDVFDGPYKISSADSQSLTTIANSYYSVLPPTPSHPRPATIRFDGSASDRNTLLAHLKDPGLGINVAEGFSGEDVSRLSQIPSMTVRVSPSDTIEHLEFNLDGAGGALADIRLRQALQYAIDKSAIFAYVYPQAPSADPFLQSTVLRNSSPFHDASVPWSNYDPDKARSLLAAAGYATSTDPNAPGQHLSIRVTTTSSTLNQIQCEIIQADWNAVGVAMSFVFVSEASLFSSWEMKGLLAHRNFDVALFAWIYPYDPSDLAYMFDPAHIPTEAHHDPTDHNFSGLTDRVQACLLSQASQTLDVAQRTALLDQWQQRINDDLPWIMLYARPQVSAIDGSIGGYGQNSAAGVSNEWNEFEWYRVDSTPTITPTATPTPQTPTPAPEGPASTCFTITPTATATTTPSDTPTATATTTPSDTPTATATSTPSGTPTATATTTPSTTTTPSPTATPTNMTTATVFPGRTAAPTETTTSTPAPGPTTTPTSTPSPLSGGSQGTVGDTLSLLSATATTAATPLPTTAASVPTPTIVLTAPSSPAASSTALTLPLKSRHTPTAAPSSRRTAMPSRRPGCAITSLLLHP